MKITVKLHSTGQSVGEIERNEEFAMTLETQTNKLFQWPEGIAEARDVLLYEEMEDFGIHPNATIFCE